MRLPNASRPRPVPAVEQPVGLEAVYLNRRAFLSQVSVGSERCSLFVPEVHGLAPGTPVQVRIRFADQLMVFDVSGSLGRCEPRGGAMVEVTGSEVRGLARAYAFARGLPLAWGRRANERVAVSLPMAVIAPSGEVLRGRVQDLSRGGARVVLPAARLGGGDTVRFVARLGLMRRVRGRGVVVWLSRGGEGLTAGIEFEVMEQSDRLALAAFLLKQRGAT